MPADWTTLLVLIPLLSGIVTLALSGRRTWQRRVGTVALVANLLAAMWALATVYAGPGEPPRILVTQMGNWPAPFGISLVLDPLAAMMLASTAVVVLAVFAYGVGQFTAQLQGGFFHPLLHFLTLGVQWSILTGDLFNLFVGFEIMLMASYCLLVQGTTRPQMRHAYKYVLLNLFSSLLFVTCCGLIYGHTGTLNLADLARLDLTAQLPPASTPVFAVLLVVFGLKSAVFPLWFWLPDAYPTMPAGLGGLFAGLLTKVGAYVVVRTFVMTFGSGAVADAVTPLLLVTAAVTMFVGVLGAVSMMSVRRILSVHVISQVGYMVLGAGLALAAAKGTDARSLVVAGTVFFIVHNMVVKTCLFLCAGLIRHHGGSDDLHDVGGLLAKAPWLATLFLIAALSLAGLPPLSGFFGKFVLLREAFAGGHWVLAGVAIATSLLTLTSMLKIWCYGFWSPAKSRPLPPGRTRGVALGTFAVSMLVCVALSMGLFANVYFDLARAAAAPVADPALYVRAVLGDVPTAPPVGPPVVAAAVPELPEAAR
ncbi:MAG TPA: proton-conducting transporter membrane subunit [Tepidisphaeraceae bacterium]|nr:proton-conducting transporter membrane subunit [Tepidisphaeraceae bacterium]